MMFLQLADGIDDETWFHDLKRGDYSRWFEEQIKGPELAEQTRELEQKNLSADESRSHIRELVERYYTPA